MSLTGSTIYLHDWRAPLRKRLESRRHVDPYQYTVPAPGPFAGRGYYASGDNGACDTRDSMFRLRPAPCPDWCNESFGIDDGGGAIWPVVLRLPRGRGFLAGWTMGAHMASTIEPDIYDDAATAWNAARNTAHYAAAEESEYQERERERIAAEEAEEARLENLADCHPPLVLA